MHIANFFFMFQQERKPSTSTEARQRHQILKNVCFAYHDHINQLPSHKQGAIPARLTSSHTNNRQIVYKAHFLNASIQNKPQHTFNTHIKHKSKAWQRSIHKQNPILCVYQKQN